MERWLLLLGTIIDVVVSTTVVVVATVIIVVHGLIINVVTFAFNV